MKRLVLVLTITLASLLGGSTAALAATPVTADQFTNMFAEKNDIVFSGGDQMTSLKIDNRTYWSVGDTMLGTEAPNGSYSDGTKMVGNHILVQTGGTLWNAIANAGTLANPDGLAVPNPPAATNGERYWAQGMFTVNGYLYVLCQRVINTGSGFELIGVELAKYSINLLNGKLSLVSMIATPSTGVKGGVGPERTQWAADAVVVGSYVYVYGYSSADDPFAPQRSYVARVPVASLESPDAWRYFDGAIWGRIMANAKALVHSQVSSVRLIGGKWVMLHKPWNNYGSDVFTEIGPNPYGPFQSTKIFSSPSGTWAGSQYETYAPQLHPEQKLASGKVLVSIAWNGKDFWTDVMGNADLYKPRFMEIAIP